MATAAGSIVLSERYARAFLDVAIEQNKDANALLAELESAAQMMQAHPELANALSTPTLAPEKRLAVLDAVMSKQTIAPATHNLLRLLTERERMPLLGLIAEQFQRLLLEHQKVQHGAVTSAKTLNEDQKSRLAERLGGALGKTMVLSYDTNENLVGGIVVRIGNRIYDASVLSQLQRFKEKALASL